ncbi:TNFA factor, partial [Eolophus roseicapillus]|nr:TNFA factor [Eolophus roseicapilla]
SRYSREYPRDVPLLAAARSVCAGRRRRDRRREYREYRDADEPWFESLYQGAVFQLRRGDQLAATATAGRFLDLHGGGRAYF